MNSNTSIFYDQQLLAIKLADIFNLEVKKKLRTQSKKKTVFPTTDSIYSREIVIELNPIKEERVFKNSTNKTKKKYNDEYYDNYFTNEYDNTNNSSISPKKIQGSNNKLIVEYDKKENENLSDNNYLVTREKSENLSSLLNKSNKNSEFSNKNLVENFNSNNKFISKSKSPITTKKIGISLNEEKGKKNDSGIFNNNFTENNSNNNKNINVSPGTYKQINFENEATAEKKKENSKELIENPDSFKMNIINRFEENNLKEEKIRETKIDELENDKNPDKEEQDKVVVKPIVKLYRKWERSRFSFANKNTNLNNLSFSEDINNTNKTIENNLNKIIMDKEEEENKVPNNKIFNLNGLVSKQNGNMRNKASNSKEINIKKNSKNNKEKNNKDTYTRDKLEEQNENDKNLETEEDNENMNDENNEINDIVPDYVYDVIRKKISRHTFFKKLEKEFFNGQTDILYFEKELKHNDSWTQFIINNLEKPKIK